MHLFLTSFKELTLLATFIIAVEGLYLKSSPVLQVTGKTYDKLIAQSNQVSVSHSEAN